MRPRFHGWSAALLLGAAGIGLSAGGVASAEVNLTAQPGQFYQLGTKQTPHTSAASPGSVYSNADNFTGFVSANGGADSDANSTENTITTMIMDDLHATNAATIGEFVFSVSNEDPAVDTGARPRIRFWAADGAGGGPGTFITGFTFNPITFTHNSIQLFTTGTLPAASQFALPQDFWAGITFDNNLGTTNATPALLNELGQGIFDPPLVGTSADTAFATDPPNQSFLGVNNPPGTQFNFGTGGPPANFGWEFIAVPEPATASLLGMMAFGLIARRRRSA